MQSKWFKRTANINWDILTLLSYNLQGRVLEPITSAYADIHDNLVAYHVT